MHTISDKIYIDFNKSKLTNNILASLTYDNPDYYMKMNMGISVQRIPQVIKTYELKDGILTVMRGEFGKLMLADPTLQFTMECTDHPVDINYVNNDFELDDLQEGAISEMKRRKQGIVHAVTSAGKSLMIIKGSCEIKQRCIIVVNRMLLMKQLLEDIDKYVRDSNGNKIKPGIIGNGKFTIGPITVAIDKTMANNMERIRDMFGILIMDECHQVPAATISKIVNNMKTERKYGFSGTLKRKDQKDFLIFATFGPVMFSIGKDVLIERERIVPVKSVILESESLLDYPALIADEKIGMNKARHIMQDFLANDQGRNEMIVKLVSELPGKTMVLSTLVAPCHILSKLLKEKYKMESGIITGRDTKQADESYDKMKYGDLKVIFATVGCVSTGISIPDLNNIVLISPIYSNELLLHQIRGRLMRKSEGKTFGTLFFVFDKYIFGRKKINEFINIMSK